MIISRLGEWVEISKEKAHHPIDSSHPFEIIFHQILQPNFLQEVFLPALDTSIYTNRDEALLTDHTAETPLLVPSCDMGQGIGQIIEFTLVEELLGHVVLQPKNLGDFHLDGHLSPDVAQ